MYYSADSVLIGLPFAEIEVTDDFRAASPCEPKLCGNARRADRLDRVAARSLRKGSAALSGIRLGQAICKRAPGDSISFAVDMIALY